MDSSVSHEREQLNKKEATQVEAPQHAATHLETNLGTRHARSIRVVVQNFDTRLGRSSVGAAPFRWRAERVPYLHECAAIRTVAVLSGRDFTAAMRRKPKEYSNVKLYVRGQLALAQRDEFIPQSLNFLVVGVDPEGLPLNFSRETLRQNKVLRVMRQKLVKKSALTRWHTLLRTGMITGSSLNSLVNV